MRRRRWGVAAAIAAAAVLATAAPLLAGAAPEPDDTLCTEVACEGSSLFVSCPSGVLEVEGAEFGFPDVSDDDGGGGPLDFAVSRRGQCPWDLAPADDVLPPPCPTGQQPARIAKSTCDGRRSCLLEASPDILGGDPCPDGAAAEAGDGGNDAGVGFWGADVASGQVRRVLTVRRRCVQVEPCPLGWVSSGLYCYLYVSEPLSQLAAQVYCQNSTSGAELVSVHSDHDQDFLHALVEDGARSATGGGGAGSANADAYIGLVRNLPFAHEDGGLGGFSWTDGSPYDYSVWRGSEPDNNGGNEACAVLRAKPGGPLDDSWLTATCTAARPFLCAVAAPTQPAAPAVPSVDATPSTNVPISTDSVVVFGANFPELDNVTVQLFTLPEGAAQADRVPYAPPAEVAVSVQSCGALVATVDPTFSSDPSLQDAQVHALVTTPRGGNSVVPRPAPLWARTAT